VPGHLLDDMDGDALPQPRREAERPALRRAGKPEDLRDLVVRGISRIDGSGCLRRGSPEGTSLTSPFALANLSTERRTIWALFLVLLASFFFVSSRSSFEAASPSTSTIGLSPYLPVARLRAVLLLVPDVNDQNALAAPFFLADHDRGPSRSARTLCDGGESTWVLGAREVVHAADSVMRQRRPSLRARTPSSSASIPPSGVRPVRR
jgi:hypothetical protein